MEGNEDTIHMTDSSLEAEAAEQELEISKQYVMLKINVLVFDHGGAYKIVVLSLETFHQAVRLM